MTNLQHGLTDKNDKNVTAAHVGFDWKRKDGWVVAGWVSHNDVMNISFLLME